MAQDASLNIAKSKKLYKKLLNYNFCRNAKRNSDASVTQNPFSYRKIINKLININQIEISEDTFTRKRPRLQTFTCIPKTSSENDESEHCRKGSNFYYEIPELKKLLRIESVEQKYSLNFRDSISLSDIQAEDQRCRLMTA